VAGSSFCRGLGPQKSDLALQNGYFWGESDYIDLTKIGNME